MVKYLDQALRYLLMLLVAVLTTSVFLQVLVRFVFRTPLPWTEELTRIAFVYCILVGATIGVREKAHINVDFLVAVLPHRAQVALKLVSNALVGVFLCFVIWQGVVFVQLTGVQVTPVLLIPFRYLYIVLPTAGAMMLSYLILDTVDFLRGVNRA